MFLLRIWQENANDAIGETGIEFTTLMMDVMIGTEVNYFCGGALLLLFLESCVLMISTSFLL